MTSSFARGDYNLWGIGKSLIDVTAQFSSEEDCVAYLEAARWPNGVRCPACELGLYQREFCQPAETFLLFLFS